MYTTPTRFYNVNILDALESTPEHFLENTT